MIKVVWVIALISSILGCLAFVGGVVSATGAPQEAAAAGIALCLAVIPYVFARAISELKGNGTKEKE